MFKYTMTTIHLSNWTPEFSAVKILPKNLDVYENENTVVLFDATYVLSKFFGLYANAEDGTLDEMLDQFLAKLRGGKKVIFMDTVFDQGTLKCFCEEFGFKLVAPKGIYGTIEKLRVERVRTRDTIPMFMKKVCEKQKRVVGVFMSAENTKTVMEMFRKIDFPMNLMKLYLKADARDLVDKKNFVDSKVLIFTLESCWGAPLSEEIDTVFGFFGGCKTKALTWHVAKMFKKFGSAKKFVYAF